MIPAGKLDYYYPAQAQIRRDPTLENGIADVWGRNNQLTVRTQDLADPFDFPTIQDPSGVSPAANLLLWVLPDRVVLSQLDSWLKEVLPLKRSN